MADTEKERDYVLGTHDEEISRLALQHRVWRPRASDAWRRAGFTTGQTILDVGCGPGHATLDLAEIVGPTGRVVALDRSRRFLDALEAATRRRGLENVAAHELDLDQDALPAGPADAAWVRWVFAFMNRPRDLLRRIAGALRPGGTMVIHEYLHYDTWRLVPRSAEFEGFVHAVIERWRASGGEPEVGLDLPRWLEELGFDVRSTTSIMDVLTPSDSVWPWPRAFVGAGVDRLVGLGDLSDERGRAIREAFETAEATPGTRMVTPAVVEIIAVKRG